jgi:hypothetical protein
MLKLRSALLCALVVFCTSAHSVELKNSIFDSVGKEYGIDPALLYSIALVESGFHHRTQGLMPWPFTLNYGNGAFFADSKLDAQRELARLRRLGAVSVDVGLMQINLKWHKNKLRTVDYWDPKQNLRVAAGILRGCLADSRTLWEGIGKYHTASKTKRQSDYAVKVLSMYKKVKRGA